MTSLPEESEDDSNSQLNPTAVFYRDIDEKIYKKAQELEGERNEAKKTSLLYQIFSLILQRLGRPETQISSNTDPMIKDVKALVFDQYKRFKPRVDENFRTIVNNELTSIHEAGTNLMYGEKKINEHEEGDPVTLFNGEFVHQVQDIKIDGAGILFVFKRTYRNQAPINGRLGFNWDHNFNLWLKVAPDNLTIIRATDQLKGETYTKHQDFDYYVPQDGVHAIIIENDNDSFVWRSPNGDRFVYRRDPRFNFLFRIERIQDKYGQLGDNNNSNYLDFIYSHDNLLQFIKINNDNRKIEFIYDGQDRIKVIKDHIGREWKYFYDDFGDLTVVIAPKTERYNQGLTTYYNYSSSQFTSLALQHNLISIRDPIGQLYIENEYGISEGSLDFNRIVRQRMGKVEWLFEYQNVVQEFDIEYADNERPAHQTNVIKPNGRLVHYIYNVFGNLLMQEEKIIQRGLPTLIRFRYRYNADGHLTATRSPEGVVTQFYYGRDQYLRQYGITDDEVLSHPNLTSQSRMAFGNLLAIVKRGRLYGLPDLDFYNKGFWGDFFDDIIEVQNRDIRTNDLIDIITKYTYESDFQQTKTKSNPQFTESADPNYVETQEYTDNLVIYKYTGNQQNPNLNLYLNEIIYPSTNLPDGTLLSPIYQKFNKYDNKGRLLESEDTNGIITKFEYFTGLDGLKEGYLKKVIIDEQGLNINKTFDVNDVGIVTSSRNGRGYLSEFKVNELNQIVRSITPPPFSYKTDYFYNRNGKLERIESEVKDENGTPILGGKEVRTLEYDISDNLSRESLGTGDGREDQIYHYFYNESNKLVRAILPRGNEVAHTYDERLLESSTTYGHCSPYSCTRRTEYNKDGLPIRQFDSMEQVISSEYDSYGRLINIIDPVGNVDHTEYDKSSNIVLKRFCEKRLNGRFNIVSNSIFIYDQMNQLTEKVEYLYQIPPEVNKVDDDLNINFQEVKEQYFYDKKGRLEKVINQKGQERFFSYDALDRKIYEKDPLNNYVQSSYDENNNILRKDLHEQVVDGNNNVPLSDDIFSNINEYDELDRLKSVMDSIGNITTFYYDSRNKIIKTIDPLGNLKRTEYDIFGRKITDISELTDTGTGRGRLVNKIVDSYEYDKNGNIIALIDSNRNRIEYVYDSLDRKIKTIYPDSTFQVLEYDCSNVISSKDNNGLISRYFYDPLGRAVRIELNFDKVENRAKIEHKPSFEEHMYDGLGRIISEKNDYCSSTIKYDSLGRAYEEILSLSSSVAPNIGTKTIKREFDLVGNITKLTYPSNRVIEYDLDELNRIKRIRNTTKGYGYPGSNKFNDAYVILENEYNGLRKTKTTCVNGQTTNFAYDGNGKKIEIHHRSDAEELILQYLYDGAGNVRLKNEFVSPRINSSVVYRYNSVYWLANIDPMAQSRRFNPSEFEPLHRLPEIPSGQSKINDQIGRLDLDTNTNYVYDQNRNRLASNIPIEPSEFVVNNLNQYIKTDENMLTYDLNGNLSNYKNISYSYDYRNLVSNIRNLGTNNDVSFLRDVRGRCILQIENRKTICNIFDGYNVIEQYNISGDTEDSALFSQFVFSGDIDSICQSTVNENANARTGKEYWYHKDLSNSVRYLTDENGSISGRYIYSEFGALLEQEGPYNPYLFMSKRSELANLYDFVSRSYFSELGRFIQRDTLPSSNLYTFVDNNPLTFVDLLGKDKEVLDDRVLLHKVMLLKHAYMFGTPYDPLTTKEEARLWAQYPEQIDELWTYYPQAKKNYEDGLRKSHEAKQRYDAQMMYLMGEAALRLAFVETAKSMVFAGVGLMVLRFLPRGIPGDLVNVAETEVAASAASRTGAAAMTTASASKPPPGASLVPGPLPNSANGITYPHFTLKRYDGLLGKLGLSKPTSNPTIEVIPNPVGSTLGQVVGHEVRHAQDFLNLPNFGYMATRSSVPGRGIAKFVLETRGYFAEFGTRGLLPNYAWRSMGLKEKAYLITEILGAAGLGYLMLRSSSSEPE